MHIFQKAEGVHGQRKVGNPCATQTFLPDFAIKAHFDDKPCKGCLVELQHVQQTSLD